MTADLNLNQPKNNIEKSPIIDSEEEMRGEDLKSDEHERIPPLIDYDVEDDSDDESTHEEEGLKHDEEKMIPCTSNPLPPQANVTSQKSKHQENLSKRGSKVKKT